MTVTQRILFYLGFAIVSGHAAAIEFKSGPQQANLIELFTSQGCSSCPPAEAYLNRFQTHPLLWKSYFPLAFHVDYWDYLGWKDRFAKPQHRLHQEAYASLNQQSSIYTPGMFVNGSPWRQGVFERMPPVSQDETGILTVSLQGTRLSAEFRPTKPNNSPWVLHAAVLGMGLKTDIAAGENSGRHSDHEFVVLHQQNQVISGAQWQMTLEQTQFTETARLALVVWVNSENNPRPVQATGGYIAFK
jgi:hypothetical protein